MVMKLPAMTALVFADAQFTTEFPGEASTLQLIVVAVMLSGVVPLNTVKTRAADWEPSEVTEKFDRVQSAGTR